MTTTIDIVHLLHAMPSGDLPHRGPPPRAPKEPPHSRMSSMSSLVSWSALPVDLWFLVEAWLDQVDLVRLGCCSKPMHEMVQAILLRRGVTLKHTVATRTLAHPKWRDLERLVVHGLPARYGPMAYATSMSLDLGVLPRLRSLDLVNPRLVESFWKTTFDTCVDLREVRVVGDFMMSNYARSVHEFADLIEIGAPRLERLDVEGGWLVMYHVDREQFPSIHEAVKRVHDMPMIASTTLRRYRNACRQVPIAIDAPLEELVIDERHDEPMMSTRLGPLTRQHATRLVWTSAWPRLDVRPLGCLHALEDATLHIETVASPPRLSACLGTMCHLPASLTSLTLDLDLWMMRAMDSGIEWGTPLGHLRALRTLCVYMLFPPDSVAELLGGWMGAGTSVRHASVRFRESAARGAEEELRELVDVEEACSEDETVMELQDVIAAANKLIDGTAMTTWLNARPLAEMHVHGGDLQVACDHPRFFNVQAAQ